MNTQPVTRALLSDEPLKWKVQPRVLFVYDPTRESLDHVKEFLGNRNCIRIAENNDEALRLIRTPPFDFDMVVLNIAPQKPGAHEDEHDYLYTCEYFLKEINKLGNLANIPVIVVSDDMMTALPVVRPYTSVCPKNVTVSELYGTARALLEGKAARKQQRVM